MEEIEATVLLPAYNEEANIAAIVEKIRGRHPHFEILVVDDGSTDGTLETARGAGARVLSHPYNIGNGAAIKTGLRHASGHWVIMRDADGQHNPDDIARLWEHRDRDKGLLTREAYEHVGGVGGALAQHAEATLENARLEFARNSMGKRQG